MIIQRTRSRRTSPTALSGAGGDALFDAFSRFASVQLPPLLLDQESKAVDAQMQQAVDDLNALYWRTGVILKVMPLDFQTFLLRLSQVGWFIPDEWVSSTTASVRGAYRTLGQRIERWQTVLRTSVWHGKTPEGNPYDLDRWKSIGKVYADEARYLAKMAISDGFYGNALRSLSELPDDFRRVVDTITTPTLWPTWLKVTAGIAAIAGFAYVLNSFTGAVRTVRGR